MSEEYSVKPTSLPTTMPKIQSIKKNNKANSSLLGGQSQWDTWKPILGFLSTFPKFKHLEFLGFFNLPYEDPKFYLSAVFTGGERRSRSEDRRQTRWMGCRGDEVSYDTERGDRLWSGRSREAGKKKVDIYVLLSPSWFLNLPLVKAQSLQPLARCPIL